jgi:UDP-N-acetylmuramyl pentapeptide phosphotransferase/UDP-N-acetylglucosamine-1-phosphate transferase
MKTLYIITLYTLFINLLIVFLKKKNLLIDKKILKHKKFVSKSVVPIAGGFLIILNLLLFNNNYYLIFFLVLIFFLGIFSDLLLISSALVKFIIQSFIIILFIYFMNINIGFTRIFFLDYVLKYKFISFLFTFFCLSVLINGSNFMDGVNTLVCGYYISVILTLLYIVSNNEIIYNFDNLYYLLISLVVIFIFNFFSKIYLGDAGTFLLSFVMGYNLISLYNDNLNLSMSISPIFIALLLWYPAFENLFSIIRKIKNNFNPLKPDNFHLHHLLFIFLQKKIKLNFANSLTGSLINFYNIVIFFYASKFYFNTKYLMYLLFLNFFIYVLFYFYLNKKAIIR